MMTAIFQEGDKVHWLHLGIPGRGRVRRMYTGKITRQIQGHKVTLDGTDKNPVVLIDQDGGGEVLKLQSDLSATPMGDPRQLRRKPRPSLATSVSLERLALLGS